MDQIRKFLQELCIKFGAPFLEAHATLKVGLSRSFNMQKHPINGLRHHPEGDTTGWYIWSGQWSDSSDFFEPHHLYHLYSQHHELIKYLGMGPGWRFLLSPNNEDVWEDLELLNIK